MPIRRAHAHAKINVGLEVLGKRPDGFHEIRSVFVPISFSDVVTAEESTTNVVECYPSVTDRIESNLAYRALHALRERTHGLDRTAKITVEKHIPSGGGLGGGSSDAAAVLRLLNDQWSLQLESHDLRTLAASLGSDVPFFLDAQTALVEGRGELVSVLSWKLPYSIVVVLPGIHVSTPDAYASLERGPLLDAYRTAERRDTFLSTVLPLFSERPLSTPPPVLPTNDFESVVFTRHPQLQEIKDKLYELGATYAAMSGSGSTMYGLFATEPGGKAAVDSFSHLTAYLCQPL